MHASKALLTYLNQYLSDFYQTYRFDVFWDRDVLYTSDFWVKGSKFKVTVEENMLETVIYSTGRLEFIHAVTICRWFVNK